MRDYSKVSTSVWHSKRFKSLSDKHKLFYLYCLTSQKCNSCGCYSNHTGYMMVDLDWEIEDIKEAIMCVEKTGLIGYDETEYTLYLHRWFDYNPPTNPKHASKVFSDTLSIPSKKLRELCILELWRFLEGTTWKVNPIIKEEVDRVSRLGSTSTSTSTDTIVKEIPIGIPKKPKPKPKKETENEIHFENFWKNWKPYITLKGSKSDAKKEYLKAVKFLSPENLIDAATKYCSLCETTDCNTKNVFRWINKKGWEDDLTIPNNKPKGNQNGNGNKPAAVGSPPRFESA